MLKQLQNLTLGVEEEYQLIDPKTRELTSYISEILKDGSVIFRDEVKPELLQSQIEIGSKVCNNLSELHKDLNRLRKLVKGYANKSNLDIVTKWVDSSDWIEFMHDKVESRSSTSITLKIKDLWFNEMNEDNQRKFIKKRSFYSINSSRAYP